MNGENKKQDRKRGNEFQIVLPTLSQQAEDRGKPHKCVFVGFL